MTLDEIKRIASSNEFWALSSGDHLNMIDFLLEYIEELEKRLSEKNLIDVLYEQVMQTGAGEGHVQFASIKGDPKATAVVSVYHEQRPSHEVLDELYLWAESKGDKNLLEKIHELSRWTGD